MSNNANASYFCNSSDFRVESLTVVNAGSSRADKALDKAFELLHDNIAIDAAHNYLDRCDAPTCYPETRKAVQGEIFSWITDGDEDDEPKQILWLTGPAGTGKTAIAGSLADTCDEKGLLAGSFFFASFTGSEKRRSKRYLVATLAYHLILLLNDQHPLRRAILVAIQRDPSIFQRRLKDQFRLLLVKPFHDTRHQFDSSLLPKGFIIDGLDEVEAANSRQLEQHEARLANEKDQEEILTALSYAANDVMLPLRIIVASRPERVIQTFFATQGHRITRTIFLDENYDPDSDITLFLNAKFAEIRRRYKLAASWPSKDVIEQLVHTASGQFIYPATVIRFLQGTKYPNPKALLDTLLDWRSRDTASDALAPLHALHNRILMSSADPLLAARWIGVIHNFGEYPAIFITQLLQDFEGQASHLSENLTSIVWVPPDEDHSSPYRLHHKSLSDYFGVAASQELHEAFTEGSLTFIGERCVTVLKDKSPAVPLAAQLQGQFSFRFTEFLCNYVPLEALDEEYGSWLADCDVVWWVFTVVTAIPRDVEHNWFSAKPVIANWFRQSHLTIRRSDSQVPLCRNNDIGNCSPQCKHWRNNILQACRALAWSAPNEVALLREAMFDAAPDPSYDWSWTDSPYFEPPSEQPESRANVQAPSTTTSYTVDEDYQATLDLRRKFLVTVQTDSDAFSQRLAVLGLERRLDSFSHGRLKPLTAAQRP